MMVGRFRQLRDPPDERDRGRERVERVLLAQPVAVDLPPLQRGETRPGFFVRETRHVRPMAPAWTKTSRDGGGYGAVGGAGSAADAASPRPRAPPPRPTARPPTAPAPAAASTWPAPGPVPRRGSPSSAARPRDTPGRPGGASPSETCAPRATGSARPG